MLNNWGSGIIMSERQTRLLKIGAYANFLYPNILINQIYY